MEFFEETGVIAGVPAWPFPRTDYVLTIGNQWGSLQHEFTLEVREPRAPRYAACGDVQSMLKLNEDAHAQAHALRAQSQT